MSAAPWTPGPWAVEHTADGRPVVVVHVGGFPFVPPKSEADARLIAAAPEMAALLEQVNALRPNYAEYGDAVMPAEVTDAWVFARDALLARVRGETP